MKVTVYFKGSDTSNDTVFPNVQSASVADDQSTLNIRYTEPDVGPVLARIPMANISHWTCI